MGSDREEVVDIRSGLAYWMVKWRWIVLAALIGALAAGGLGYLQNHKKASPVVEVTYEERAEKLRATLQESDALYVEQLASQYKAYGERLNKWNQYSDCSVLQNLDPYNYVRKDVQYAVSSDNSSAVNAFTTALLGQKEYEEIGELMGKDPLTASLQEIVTVTDAALVSSSAIEPADDTRNTSGSVNTSGATGNGRIILVTILAEEEAQADGIQKIADAAIRNKCSQMKKSGVDISAAKISESIVKNDANWLLNRQNTEVVPRIQMQSNRSNFVKNSVDTLSEGQKNYFNFLCKDETESTGAKAAVKKVNLKKYAAAGFIGGLLIALLAVYLSYIFSDKIRTEEELRDNYKLPILQKFDISAPGKGPQKTDPIRRKGLSILGADRAAASAEKGAELLEAELGRRLSRENSGSLFIAYDCEEERVRSTVDVLAGKLSGDSIKAETGNPFGDDGAYQKLLGSDSVIIAETLNRSGKKLLKELTETCRRNGIKVLGCITLIDAQNY